MANDKPDSKDKDKDKNVIVDPVLDGDPIVDDEKEKEKPIIKPERPTPAERKEKIKKIKRERLDAEQAAKVPVKYMVYRMEHSSTGEYYIGVDLYKPNMKWSKDDAMKDKMKGKERKSWVRTNLSAHVSIDDAYDVGDGMITDEMVDDQLCVNTVGTVEREEVLIVPPVDPKIEVDVIKNETKLNKKGSNNVPVVVDGVEYENANVASKELGISMGHLMREVRNDWKTKK